MQTRGSGINAEGGKGLDFGGLRPTVDRVPVDLDHVVSAAADLGALLGRGSGRDLDVLEVEGVVVGRDRGVVSHVGR